MSAIDEYREWARATCSMLVPADPPIGKIFSCPIEGKPPSNRDGRGKLHLDGIAAGWGQNWTDGTGAHTWCSKADSECSPAERAVYRAQVQAMRHEREAEDIKAHAEAMVRDERRWKAANEYEHYPYTDGKGILPHGTRVDHVDGEDRILIPVRGVDGKLHGLQRITPDGTKLFTSRTEVTGNFFIIGDITGKPGERVVQVEGFGTGAAVNEATGYPVVVAFDCGNQLPAAEAILKKYPSIDLVICADDDWKKPGNPGRSHATEAAKQTRARLIIPKWSGERPEKSTDMDDLGRDESRDVVKQQVEAAFAAPTVEIPPRISVAALDLWSRPNPPALATPWAPLNDFLGGGLRGLNALVAPTGVGKTSLALTLGIHAAATVPVLYVSTELGAKQAIARIAGQLLKQSWRPLWEGSAITGSVIASATAALNIRCLEFRDCAEVFAVATAMAAIDGTPPFLILDYLQGAAREPGIDRRLAVSGVSNSTLQWCRATGAPALMVASTARISYKADDQTGRDLVGTAKESGDVEYDCGSVLYAKMESCPLGGTAGGEIHVCKSRFGTVGWVQVTFHGPSGTFALDTTGLDVVERKVLAAIRANLHSGSAIAKAVRKQKKTVLDTLETLRERGFIDADNYLLDASKDVIVDTFIVSNDTMSPGTGSASGSGSGTGSDLPSVSTPEPLHGRAAVNGTGSHPPKGGTGNRSRNHEPEDSLEAHRVNNYAVKAVVP